MVLNFVITETTALLGLGVCGPPAAEHAAELNVGWLADGEHLARHTRNLPDITTVSVSCIQYFFFII